MTSVDSVSMGRSEYFKNRYLTRKQAGLCTRCGCSSQAEAGKSYCSKHLKKNATGVRLIRRRRMLETRTREKLPIDRSGFRLHFTILNRKEVEPGKEEAIVEEVKGYCHTGEYEDGRLGEVFIKLGKAGEESALFDQWGIAASIALQYGAGVEELFSKHTHTSFAPSGKVLGVKDIESCTSILDLVSRWVIKRYANRKRK